MAPVSFNWDKNNALKIQSKHKISTEEAESSFYDPESKSFIDIKHSTPEETRYICIGKSYHNRILFTVYTFRNEEIRIISSRPAKSKEKEKFYPE